MLNVYLHIFEAFVTDLFINFFDILGYMVHLQVSSDCHKSSKFFLMYLLKKIHA